MENRLIKIQDILYNQMKRLDDNDLMENGTGQREIQRSGALSQSAGAYIKSVQTQLKVKEMSKKNPDSEKTILSEIGVLHEDLLDD